MRRAWILGAVTLVGLVAAGWFLTERPLIVSVVPVEKNVPLRLYGLGSVEARVMSRVGFEVGAALVSADAGDAVKAGQELAALHPAEQEARVARAQAVLAQRIAANERQTELALLISTRK